MSGQRTIKDTVVVSGIGLQTGNKVSLTLKSSPADSGINFIRTDLPDRPVLNIQSLDLGASQGAERRTMLGMGPLQIQTTEHLLAAISGLSIDNIVIEIDNVELPGLDGSAKGFVEAIRKAGITEQDSAKKIAVIENPVWCKSHDATLVILPDDSFKVSYTLSYPVIGAQFFTIDVNESSFEREVAPARTFCSQAEVIGLLSRGLGKGANYENTLVMGPKGPIKNTLRFPDELARHKALDLIGDLCLFGSAIRGHVVAVKSGHKLNMEMVKKLKETYRWETSRTI